MRPDCAAQTPSATTAISATARKPAVGGVCRAGELLNCNDLNPCTDDQCIPALGCVSTADDNNLCDDRLLCNGPEQCIEGICVSTDPEACDASDECQGEQCNDGGGGGEEGGDEEGDGEGDGGGGGEGGGGGGGSGGSGEENLPNTAGTGSIFVDDNGSQQPGYDSSLLIGSANRPFSSLQSAANVVLPGDTVFVRGGVYFAPDNVFVTPVLHVGRGGTAASPVRFESYQDEKVIFDGRAVLSSNDNGNRRGIYIPGNVSYVEISGIVVRNAFREGIMVNGDHVTVEDCIVENCGLNTNNAESLGIKFDFCQFHTARRCVVRHCYSGLTSKNASDGLYEDCLVYNCGFTPGGTPIYPENANGIGTAAARNGSDRVRMVRCVSFGNLDDQIDMGHSRDCSAEGCYVFNGNAQNIANGDGWGFKVGNDQDEPVGSGRECRRNLVRYCIAFNNKSNGIDARDAIDGEFYNNTAYGNRGQFGISTGSPGHAASFYNNLSWGNDQQDVFVGDDAKIGDYNNWANGAGGMLPAGDQHSIRANPGFANPDAAIDTSWQQFAADDVRGIMPTLNNIRNQVTANFALTNTTPSTTSIDRGAFIAQTTSAGAQTTQINVNKDPRRVFRNGDAIRLEGGATAVIQSMTASRITVDRNVSFTNGAGVHLNFNGNSPDAGAGEY